MRKTAPEKNLKKIKKTLKKPLTNKSKSSIIKVQKRWRYKKMYRVIRICEITGRVNTVAECVTLEQANAIIVARAKDDDFGDYRKVEINPRAELKRAVINLITKG